MRRIRNAYRFSSALLAFTTILLSNLAMAQDLTSIGGSIFGAPSPKSEAKKDDANSSIQTLDQKSVGGVPSTTTRFEAGGGMTEGSEEGADWLEWIASKSKTSKKSSSSWLSNAGSSKKKPSSLSYSRNNKTTWQKFQQSSKQAWRKTADVLNPYPPAKPASAKKSGNSWFSGSGDSKDTKKIDSVPEWLGQESPR